MSRLAAYKIRLISKIKEKQFVRFSIGDWSVKVRHIAVDQSTLLSPFESPSFKLDSCDTAGRNIAVNGSN